LQAQREGEEEDWERNRPLLHQRIHQRSQNTLFCGDERHIRNLVFVSTAPGVVVAFAAYLGLARPKGVSMSTHMQNLGCDFPRRPLPRTPVNNGVRAGVVRLGPSMDIGEPPSTLASTPPPSGHWSSTSKASA